VVEHGLACDVCIDRRTLPRDRRAMGFTVQAILKRVPVMLSPTIGGLLIATFGILRGVRYSLIMTIALALLAILAQRRFYFISDAPIESAFHQTAAQCCGVASGAQTLAHLGHLLRIVKACQCAHRAVCKPT